MCYLMYIYLHDMLYSAPYTRLQGAALPEDVPRFGTTRAHSIVAEGATSAHASERGDV